MVALPDAVHFEGLPTRRKFTYRVMGFRPPRRGEFYLSGAVVWAFRAPADLRTPYQVVEPLEEYTPKHSS